MEELNKLLNEALQTKNQDYVSPDGMLNCFQAFEKLSKKDSVASKVLMYFFPENSSLEKNDKEFWFIKYKNDLYYNEYSFAKDLLQTFNQYKKFKNKQFFEMIIKDKIQLFKDRKLISEFFYTLEKTEECINATIAYILKDPSYFKLSYNINVPPEKIQKHSFIKEVKNYLEIENLRIDLKNGQSLINQYSNLVEDLNIAVKLLKEDNTSLTNKVNDMQKTIDSLKKQQNETDQNLKNVNERLEQIDVRDTIKMSFRYLYKILYSKFPDNMDNVSKIWQQIMQVKIILSKPQFKEYEFITKFIDVIDFNKLDPLNKMTHDSSQTKRNFSNIKKFLQPYSDEDLQVVSNYFENLPLVDKFISLSLKFFLRPNKVDEEFQKNMTYSEIYDKVFKSC